MASSLHTQFDRVAHDPLDPAKRYHVGIFVEKSRARQLGSLFHVTGDVIAASGMRYEERLDCVPTASKTLHNITEIGRVHRDDYYSGRIYRVLAALPTPTKQQGINFWEPDPVTRRHEIIWTKENGERYGPGEQRRPVFKCNEWTHEYAVPTLRNEGILLSLDRIILHSYCVSSD
ncbi:hypothetical protein BJX70DRAFT_170580 [Aspergillus crustosus]